MDSLILKGSLDASELFRPGINTVTTDGPLVVTYVNQQGEQTDLYMLDIGTHLVRVPSKQKVLVEAHESVSWDVSKNDPLEYPDPTPVEITVLKPRNMMDEMKQQVANIVARALKTTVDQLESEEDMQDFDMDDDQGGAPLSIHQIQELIPDELRGSQPQPKPVPAHVESKDVPAPDPEVIAE